MNASVASHKSMFAFLEYLLTKVVEPAKLKVVQSNAGNLAPDSSHQGQAQVALEARLRELERSYLAGNLTAKNYLEQLTTTYNRESTEEDEVASTFGSDDEDPEDAIPDQSDWDDQDEDWFTVAGINIHMIFVASILVLNLG